MEDESESEDTDKYRIYLYKTQAAYSFPISELGIFLKKTLGSKLASPGVEIRSEFLQTYVIDSEDQQTQNLAGELLAKSRLEDIGKKVFPAEQGESKRVFYSAMELGQLEGIPPEKVRNNLYHGPRLMSAYRRLLPESERSVKHIHIIFTDRLFCTWDDSDFRYHTRVVMLGFPHLISMPGIVEAPARPREYYIKRHLYASTNMPQDELEAEFAGQYIIYKDARTLEVLKGYSLQALFYSLFNEPFCEDPHCRLFNAHWQAEMLEAQIDSGKLCERHQSMLDDWKVL